MFEKVNPAHPDKVADRIAGAIVDLAYKKQDDPKVAVEVLIGHGVCHIIAETSVNFDMNEIENIVHRIAGIDNVDFKQAQQDPHLADNQNGKIRCGDNGIFCGMPETDEEYMGFRIARKIYRDYQSDGKYIYDLNSDTLIICQSNADKDELAIKYPHAIINPLGYWTGGTNVDTGATNRKLGSDMGRSVTGGGLHGKDLSKADVSVNIYAYELAQERRVPIKLFCAIGDEEINGIPYSEIVEFARQYIQGVGGFEKFAEWGLIR